MDWLVVEGGDSNGVFDGDEESDQGLDEGCLEEGRVLGVSLADLRT